MSNTSANLRRHRQHHSQTNDIVNTAGWKRQTLHGVYKSDKQISWHKVLQNEAVARQTKRRHNINTHQRHFPLSLWHCRFRDRRGTFVIKYRCHLFPAGEGRNRGGTNRKTEAMVIGFNTTYYNTPRDGLFVWVIIIINGKSECGW